ncbi:MAG: CBS domain-containing protein [Xanthobacteraceae bacterium]
MRIEHFMTRRVVAVSPDTSILAAARLMLEHHISGLPVVDASGHVVAIVSESDLLRDDGKGMAGSPWLQLMVGPDARTGEPAQLGERKVAEVMTRDPVTVAPADSIAHACRLLEQRGIKRLPVVHDGELVGIIARADLVRAFAQSAEKSAPAPMPDVSIDSRLAELERQIWRSRARVSRPF